MAKREHPNEDGAYPLRIELLRAGEQVEIVEAWGPGTFVVPEPGPCDVRITLPNGDAIEVVTPQPDDCRSQPVHKTPWIIPGIGEV